MQRRPLAPEEVPADSGVPAPVLLHYREFWRCGRCRKIYWTGQLYQRARTHLAARLCAAAAAAPCAAAAMLR